MITLRIHLKELQIKLFYLLFSWINIFFICFLYKIKLFFYVAKPLILFNKQFIFTDLSSGFWVYFKLSFLISLIFLMPLVIYFVSLFLLKGLFNNQIRILFILLNLILISLVIVIFILFFFFLPQLVNFFIGFETISSPLIIQLQARIDKYFNFVFFLLWMTLILLLSPFIFIFYQFFNNAKKLKPHRGIIYSSFLFFFILLAPPDPLSQLTLLIIYFFLIEIYLFLFLLIKKFV